MTPSVARASPQRILDRDDGFAWYVYDAARKHYLLGRDRALRKLLERPWRTLAEIGPGTGRHLRRIHDARQAARCPWASFEHGFAEDLDLSGFCGSPPDRVLLSYCLSMIPEPAAAVATIRAQLAARSELWVVDFADGAGLPSIARKAVHRWLGVFHVTPLHGSVFAEAASVEFGPARHYAIARFRGTRRVRTVLSHE